MIVHPNPFPLQTLAVSIRRTLAGVMGNHDRRHHKATTHKLFAKTQHVLVIRDTEVLTHLIPLDIFGRKDDEDLQRVTELREHTQLTIRQKTRQHTAGVHVIEEFTT